MAKAKASSATGKNPNNLDTPSITVIKKATTKSLEGKASLGYWLGIDDTSALHWRLASNSGGDIGMSGDAPYINNSKWTISLRNSPGAKATLFVSLRSNNIAFPYGPFAAGSYVSIDPGPPLFLPLAVVNVSGGNASVPAAIPNTPGLVGKSAFFQWASVNAASTQAWLSTAGGVVFQK